MYKKWWQIIRKWELKCLLGSYSSPRTAFCKTSTHLNGERGRQKCAHLSNYRAGSNTKEALLPLKNACWDGHTHSAIFTCQAALHWRPWRRTSLLQGAPDRKSSDLGPTYTYVQCKNSAIEKSSGLKKVRDPNSQCTHRNRTDHLVARQCDTSLCWHIL